MKCFFKKEEIETDRHSKIYDITEEIIRTVKESGFSNGLVLIQPLHTTVGIYVNEGEERLLEDFVLQLAKRVPHGPGLYLHDDISERKDCPSDEPINGHSHMKASFYSNPSVSLVICDGRVCLGRYQRILFAEFDGPCPRKNKDKRNYVICVIGK